MERSTVHQQSTENLNKTFKLYINAQHKKIWEAIRYSESLGMNPSTYICKKVINGFIEDQEMEGTTTTTTTTTIIEDKSIEKEKKKGDGIIESLIELAQEYEVNGIDGLDISYVLPRMFSQGKILKEEMVDLIVFVIKLYLTTMKTRPLYNSLVESSGKLLNSKRDIVSSRQISEFKDELLNQLQIDIAAFKREEIKQKQREREIQIKKVEEIRQANINLEREKWNLLHPDKPYWTRNMTDEEIEFSNQLLAGEIVIPGSAYDYGMDENGDYIQ